MPDPINLNKARKARAKAAGKKTAAENRVRHGRTKAERSVAKALDEKDQRELDAKRRLHEDE
jgi:Domain of unknown function (DUF4169)